MLKNFTNSIFTIILSAFTFISCTTVGHFGKFTDKTWGNPSDFLTEMEGNSQTLSDEDLQTQIENSFLYDSNLGHRRPQVRVKDQVVTLSGDLNSLNAKESIETQVRSMSTVRGVMNLTHSLPPGSRRDPQFSRDAQLALALNSNLVGNKIHVSVKNGIIHLTGEVKDLSQKRLAGQIVALGRGSYLIRNRIRINSGANS